MCTSQGGFWSKLANLEQNPTKTIPSTSSNATFSVSEPHASWPIRPPADGGGKSESLMIPWLWTAFGRTGGAENGATCLKYSRCATRHGASPTGKHAKGKSNLMNMMSLNTGPREPSRTQLADEPVGSLFQLWPPCLRRRSLRLGVYGVVVCGAISRSPSATPARFNLRSKISANTRSCLTTMVGKRWNPTGTSLYCTLCGLILMILVA